MAAAAALLCRACQDAACSAMHNAPPHAEAHNRVINRTGHAA